MDAMQKLASIETNVAEAQQEFAKRLQTVLDELVGREFGTLAEKQNIARRIQAILSSINHKVQCTRCSEPAGIKVSRSLTEETGVFQFDHTSPKRTTHQGCVNFPILKVVPAPECRRLKNSVDKAEGENAGGIVNDDKSLDTDWMGE